MRARPLRLLFALVSSCAVLCLPHRVEAAPDFTVFESGPVRPLALSPDGTRLFAVNTPDNRLEIFDVTDAGLSHSGSVFVGLEPVAVAARSSTEVWVVNHLSDSVSIVDVSDSPRVTRTLLVGDEPRDVVFAGPDLRLAFITTAHRGQNSPIDPEPFEPSIGRADVWVLDSDDLGPSLNGDPKTIFTLFGDSPRALAASADGRTVYAGIFLSGNRTTVVAEEAVCDGGAFALPCEVKVLGMPGGLPLPNANDDGVPGPETGLIVKYNLQTQIWEDQLGRNWNNAARFRLPDTDVFAIDAYADPPQQIGAYAGVGTVLYNMAVNPVTGVVYVSNTEARNEVRLGRELRGHQHESHLTLIDGTSVLPRDLNKHLNCSPSRLRSATPCEPGGAGAAGEPKAHSLALPNAIAVSPDGATVYVAAYGSARIGVFSAALLADDSFDPSTADHIELSAGGPSGIALDPARQRLYVATRFDNGISVVDLSGRNEMQHVRSFNPEPQYVQRGRRFLYDADYISANGEAACASCHVFGDFDGLAWDMGEPSEPVLPNHLPMIDPPDPPDVRDFHPLKGPMTTQTLQGLRGHGPMHWRGDRNGELAGGDPMDERAALRQFNPSFVSLLGRDEPLSDEEVEIFTDFILDITPPPNPYRNLDNSLNPTQLAARATFFQAGCNRCHELDPANLRFGTSRKSTVNSIAPQFMKVPQLRNFYKKIGRYLGVLFQPLADPMPIGDQVRGFGFQHDGSAGRTADPADEFLIAFDSNLAPVVGQQLTVGSANAHVLARLTLLKNRAAAGECDLTVRGIFDGEERGWLWRGDGSYAGDRNGAAADGDAELRQGADGALTYTCVPPGAGLRAALDRDRDGFLDGDERAAGSDPADPDSVPQPPTSTPTQTETPLPPTPTTTPPPTPTEPAPTPTEPPPTLTATPTASAAAATATELAATRTPTPTFSDEPTQAIGCSGDCNGDGVVTADDLREGIGLLFNGSAACSLDRFDRNGNGRVGVAELLAAVGHPCD